MINDQCALHGLSVHDAWCVLHRGGLTCSCDHFERAGRVHAVCTCVERASAVLLANMHEARVKKVV